MGLFGRSLITDGTINSITHPIHVAGYFLNPRYHYRVQLGDDLIGEVKDGLYECLEGMVPDESEQMEIHRHINSFNRATRTFGKTLAKKARDEDGPGKQLSFNFKSLSSIV